MSSVFFESGVGDDARRERLYAGDLFVYAPVPGALALVELARELIHEAFPNRDPELAQYDMAVEDYAEVLAVLKPKFIHHPRAKECIRGILRELGCDLGRTHFDVPRMRTATSGSYLTSGIAYAFHPHRDTWYSAPPCQINWWLPIYDIQPSNAMAFHPRYWSQPLRNSSRHYDYAEWNRTSRREASKHVKTDTRPQPRAEEPVELDSQLRLLPQVGGIILFSGAQLHSTVANDSGRTRFSIDFRTVHHADVVGHLGAPNLDSECTGTTMRDYLRATDLAHLPEEVCREYECGTPLVCSPTGAGNGVGLR